MEKEIQLLLVEDNPADAELLVLNLEENGFLPVWERVDNAQLLEKALQDNQWDIVISDYMMPSFSGLEALRIIRQHDPILPFILVSGAIGEETAVMLMKEGAQDYLLKHNLLRLATAVQRELEEAKIKYQANRHDQLLRESKKRLEIIYNGTSELMSLIRVQDNQFIIESVNQAFVENYRRLIGPLEERLQGMSFTYFLSQLVKLKVDEINDILEQYRKVVQHKLPQKIVERYTIGNNSVYLELTRTPIIQNESCTHILSVSRDVTESVESANKLKKTLEEVRQLKNRLEQENLYLKEEIQLKNDFEHIVFRSEKVAKLLKEVEQVAPVDATVLILGETGTGKELIARSVHNLSKRKDHPLVKINCAALPKELIESELFGHEKGTFTGATHQKIGKFELAQNGTIFLDEIAELPIELQAKLLRVLQEGELQRLGGNKTIKLNVRIIAATNKDLRKAIDSGTFREDLFYRLNVFPIQIPPLRERKDDIEPLFLFFADKFSRQFNKKVEHIPSSTLSLLQAYDWPGNVRELETMIERAVILSQNGHLSVASLFGVEEMENNEINKELTALKAIEKQHILKILKACNGKINGPGGAAQMLELPPSTLRDKMKKLGISRSS